MESAQTTGRMTVREYAEAHNISHQAIYRKIKRGQLQTEKEKINGKEVVFILPDGVHNGVVSNATPVQPVQRDVQHLQPDVQQGVQRMQSDMQRVQQDMQQVCNQEEVAEVADLCNHATTFATDVQPDMQPVQPPETAGEQNMIAFLQEQLREKDKQIERLQDQNRQKDEIITDQLSKMNELLRNSQLLQAQVNTLLLKSNTGETEPEEGDQASPETTEDPEPEQTPEPQKKRRGFFYRLFFGED